MSVDLTKLAQLSVADLYALRIAVNSRLEDIESEALEKLKDGIPVPHFQLKKGRNSRFIADPELYSATLRDAFEDQYEDLCVTKKVIALTGAEKLIKDNFDPDDAATIKKQLAESLSTKTAESKLEYVP